MQSSGTHDAIRIPAACHIPLVGCLADRARARLSTRIFAHRYADVTDYLAGDLMTDLAIPTNRIGSDDRVPRWLKAGR
jgi:hypothetical protein